MGFYHIEKKRQKEGDKKINIELIKKFGCSCCYFKDTARTCDMQPIGADNPDIYILGCFPSRNDDINGEPFSDELGDYLRLALANNFDLSTRNKSIRFNNVMRCHPRSSEGSSRIPKYQELEFCRMSVVKDIEKSKPKYVCGIDDKGNLVINWMLGVGNGGSQLWRGRKVPVKIGEHVCWYIPMIHPSFVLRNKSKYGYDKFDHVFNFDIKNVANLLKNEYESPIYIDNEDEIKQGIKCLYDPTEIKLVLDRLNSENEYLSVDIENYPLRPYSKDAEILCVGVSNFEETYSFMYNNDTKEIFKEFLYGKSAKISHNLQHEMEWFITTISRDLAFKVNWEDSMSQAYVLDERKVNKRGLLGLNDLSRLYFGFYLKDYSGIIYKDVRSTPTEDLLAGCGLDSKWTYKLWEIQKDIINGTQLEGVYRKHVEAAIGLDFTQNRGVLIDFDVAKENSDMFLERFEEVKSALATAPEIIEFEKRFGRKFNPRSDNKDLPDLFIEMLGLRKFDAKNKRGYSLDEVALGDYAKQGVESADLILKCREWGDLYGKYAPSNYDKKEGAYIYDDGLIHTSFLHLHTETGRLSSRNPNLQNIDKHDHKYVRKMFIAPEDHWLMAFDYGQIQVRFIGVESGDEVLLDYCREGHDFHMEFAVEFAKLYPKIIGGIENLDNKKIMGKFRQSVKSDYVFAKFFGSVDEACAMRLGIPVEIVNKVTQKLWKMFSGVKRWHKDIFDFYIENGYVQTKFGRRRRAPLSKNQIINSSIQGLEVECVNSALYRLVKLAYELNKPQYIPVISIHDDLSFYIPNETMEDDTFLIAKEMVRIPKELDFITVPLTIEIELGKDWYAMEELIEYSTTDFTY